MRANFGKNSGEGVDLPLSHLPTATWVMPSFLASAACVRPAARRFRRNGVTDTNGIDQIPPVNNKSYHQLLNDIVTPMQPIVTTCFVEKPKQWHFYVPPSLRASCEAVFEKQGVSVSQGMTRLVRLLVDSSDELRPILLDQAHGDAAVALAESIIKRARAAERKPGYPRRVAAKEDK
jgi:hypothetical protein